MMKYKIVIQKKALKILETINEPDYTKIKSAILLLASNPRPHGYKKLTGRDGYRIRIGNYRIIYDVFDKILVVEIIAIGHRSVIYN